MPKAKKSSKKDTSSFIKKVASAGRGGDSELAYLSPKARDLLKKLGGAGTMNPATGLKEFKAAARFARTAQDSLDEFNALRQATLDRMAEQTLAPPAAPVAERETIQPTFEEETITPAPTPAPAPVQAPAQGTAAADLAQFSERDMIPRGGEQEAITPAPAPASVTQPPYSMQFDPSRLRAPDTAATNLAQLMEVGKPDQEPMASTPAAIMQAREQEARDMIPREEDVAVAPAPSPGYTPLTPAQLAALANIQASGFGRLTTGPNATGPSWTDLFAEEERRRAAAEEAARKAAEEEAARKAAEEAAARRAAEEAARRAAEEEARRRAEEQARYIAEQEAAARRAAEEARRVAAEAEARRLADEEARRRAAEEEARRRAEPPAPPPPPPPPPPLQTTLPPGLITSPLPTPPPPPTAQPPAAAPPTSATTPAEPPPPPRPQGINLFSQAPGGFFSAIDPNSDIGRLIAKLRERGAGRGFSGVTGGTPNAPISPIAQIAGSLPTASAPMPTSPVQSAVAPTAGLGALSNVPIPVTQLPTPGYTAAPLPQLVGAGTPTPFFNPSAGGLTPGTVPVSQMPQSLQTADVPLQALATNPNLSPTVLGGPESLGYYVDRFGNVILAPATPRGRKEGGPASDAELLQALQEGSGGEDMASARAMLEQLSNEPGESRTEVKLSPTAQSVKRVSRRPIRAETDRGVAKGMAMELEEITKSQGPRAKGRAEEMQQRMELIRNTLGIPTFSKAGLGRAGDLLAKRFAEGGEAKRAKESKPTGEFGMFGGLKQMLLESDAFKSMTPLQIRTFLQSVEGLPEMRTMPITEKDLDEEELNKLRDVVEFQKRLVEDPGSYTTSPSGEKVFAFGNAPNQVNYLTHEMYKHAKQGRYSGLGSHPLAVASKDLDPNVRDDSSGLPGTNKDTTILPSANLRNTLGNFSFRDLPDGTTIVTDRYDFTKDMALGKNPLVDYAEKFGVNRPVNIVLPPKKKEKRFQEGGEAKSALMEFLTSARDKLIGAPEEEGPAVQGPLPKPGPGTRRYFEERGRALKGSPPTGIEREAQIRAKLGPEYQEAITKLGETAMIGDPMDQWSLWGINFTPNKSQEEMTKYMENRLDPILSMSPERKLPKGKRIFAIGRKATPQIYAHELRHEGIFDEGYNRLMDLVNSGSAPAYRDNIESLYNYHIANDPVYENADDSGQDFLASRVPFKDKERYVLNTIRPSLTRYFQKEAPVFSGGDWGSEILRQNYNLNALGAKGAVKDTGEQLQRKVIKERARYPFLNFVGRENMPVAEEEKNQFALPPYLDSSISDSTRKTLLPLPEAVIKHLNQVQKNKKK